MEWAEWAADHAHNCPTCRKIYSSRNPPEEPPCETCRVDLMEENDEAARIYMLCRGQVIVGGDQVLDINHMAVWEAIDRYGVQEPVGCFEKVNRAFHHMLARQREERG